MRLNVKSDMNGHGSKSKRTLLIGSGVIHRLEVNYKNISINGVIGFYYLVACKFEKYSTYLCNIAFFLADKQDRSKPACG